MHGIILVNKPSDMTSHDVVSLARRQLKMKKIGHTGTLDPFATGLVILVVGQATKLSDFFINYDKTYEGIITFGYETDTYDVTGIKTLTKTPQVVEVDILKMMKKMTKVYMQVPPMYSAIKIAGQKMYELARKNQIKEIDPREVEIYSFSPLSPYQNLQIGFKSAVSKGTYIRSLVVDLGRNLNELATLTALTRTNVGPYRLVDACDVNDITADKIITFNKLFATLERLELSDYLIHLVKNGTYLDERQTKTTKMFIVENNQKEDIALYVPQKDGTYKPLIIF